MKPVAVVGMSALLLLDGATAASAQFAIAFFTDPWGTCIELTEGLDEY